MAQKQYTTYQADILSFELRDALVGIIKPGRYIGYDAMTEYQVQVGDNVYVRISHSNGINKYVIWGYVCFKMSFTFQMFQCAATSLPSVLTYIVIIAVMLMIWAFSLYIKIPILNIFVGFVFCYFALYVGVCFQFAMIMFFVMGITSMLYGAVWASK